MSRPARLQICARAWGSQPLTRDEHKKQPCGSGSHGEALLLHDASQVIMNLLWRSLHGISHSRHVGVSLPVLLGLELSGLSALQIAFGLGTIFRKTRKRCVSWIDILCLHVHRVMRSDKFAHACSCATISVLFTIPALMPQLNVQQTVATATRV